MTTDQESSSDDPPGPAQNSRSSTGSQGQEGIPGPRSGPAGGDTSPNAIPGPGEGSLGSPSGGTVNSPSMGGFGKISGTTGEKGGQVAHQPDGGGISRAPESPEGLPAREQGKPGQDRDPGRMGFMAALAGGGIMAWSGPAYPAANTAPGYPHSGPNPSHRQQGPPAQSSRCPCGPAQAGPALPPQRSAQTGGGEGTAPRPRSKQEEEDLDYSTLPASPSPAVPMLPLFPFGVLFGGYRRISKRNVLEQNTRNTVFQSITASPGIDVPTLSKVTGINENTLRYHLVKLTALGRITSLIRPGVIRYFLNGGAFGFSDKVVIHYLREETSGKIIEFIRRSPGMTRQQISDYLGISGPSVTRHMEHLVADGVIENRLSGRSNHYYLTEKAMTIFCRLHPAMGISEVSSTADCGA